MRALLLSLPLLPGCVFLVGVFGEDCQNGQQEGSEECDDGNAQNNDACLNTCQQNTCGDNFTNIGVEGCDDGNTTNGDGCNAICADESLCGNGALDPGEQCDTNVDGCTPLCSLPVCGDGFLQSGVEDCDDGNQNLGDGCRPDCTLEACGDGSIDPNELCLEPPISVVTEANPARLVVADLNQDNHTDIVVATNDPAQIQIFFGDGIGTFSGGTTFSLTTASNSGGLAILDLNQDTRPDIVADFNTTGTNTGFLVVGLQNAARDFVFTEITGVNIGQQAREIVGENLSGDPAPELLIASEGDGGLRSLLNAGDGLTFSPGNNFDPLAGSFGLALADFDNDGLLDLINTGGGAGVTSANLFLRNTPDLFFTPINVFVNGSCIFVITADFNQDNLTDFATSCLGSGFVSVLIQNSSGGFSLSILLTLGPASLFSTDMDSDDLPDIVVANQNNASVSVFLNNGQPNAPFGSFASQVFSQLNTPTSIAGADFNEDGSPDIITTNLQTSTLSLLLSNP